MLRGWKFVGLSATIILYVLGILVLSIVNLQTPRSEKRVKNSRYVTDVNYHRNEVGLIRKTPLQLQWCSELHFMGQKSSPFKLKAMSLETFPGHKINRNSFIIESNHVMLKETVKSDQHNNNFLSIASTMKSDNNEFNDNDSNNNNNDNEKVTALASFPGSGNTWLRYLLQQATGILTGSVYKDYGLLKSGFPAESISNSSVLLVKTHEWGSHVWSKFNKAILLVRDPARAIVAEFNRQSGGHVGFASPDRYKRTKGKYWIKFVTTKLHAWEQTNLSWGRNFSGPVLIIWYEDLVDDVEKTIRDVLRFIDYPINEDLMRCAIMRKEGIYRRKKRLLTFDPYTTTMKKMIEQKRAQVYAELGRNKKPK
ncbi:CLUMA_CG015069, isoform A [Clunio marinus]|uniref:CLUMA_CG015069, isoform A n=1 Tax=Clunio marinus TaxID=568069 RepID=A0A1J1INX8_9DIPT|nr:CLUMA_CG015069, isoform A [Clunio marinus]